MRHDEWFLIWFAFCSCSAYALGGAAERVATVLQLAALVASRAAKWMTTHYVYGAVHVQTGIIDALLLAALCALALRANRFWPMWLVAFQLQSVLAHVARAIDGQMLPTGYYFIENFEAWPMIGITAFGAMRHHYRRKRFGIDPSF